MSLPKMETNGQLMWSIQRLSLHCASRLESHMKSLLHIINRRSKSHSPGDVIILPGLEGISGTILNLNMPLGESLRSMTRRYQMNNNSIIQLNQISSPSQLYVGYPLLIASSFGEALKYKTKLSSTRRNFTRIICCWRKKHLVNLWL